MEELTPPSRPINLIRQFIKLESSGGILLFAMAMLAIVLDNSPFAHWYTGLLSLKVAVHIGALNLAKPLVLWINDGFMAVFFLLVGLEMKREILEGELSSMSRAMLPGIGAVGGMLAPALVYFYLNRHDSYAVHGWAIPTATDIAFSLGILTLLGRRIPTSLKVFLTALAIFDDLGAIIIIAIFYTSGLSWFSLAMASVCIIGLIVLNRTGVRNMTSYVIVGVVLWICVLKSGVHATLAGVVLAFAIPHHDKKDPGRSPLRDMEKALHPWVAYAILPLFAFANAGINFSGISWPHVLNPIPIGIALGLFLGKQLGIFGLCWIAIKAGWARLPTQVTWLQLYGISLICGVGFTMSLFIGTLAFAGGDGKYAAMIRLGVIAGSLVSGVSGYLLLRVTARKQRS